MKCLGILGIDGALYLNKWKYLPKVANSYKNVWKIDNIYWKVPPERLPYIVICGKINSAAGGVLMTRAAVGREPQP